MAAPLIGLALASEALIAATEAVLMASGIVSGVALSEKIMEVEKKKRELSKQSPKFTQTCANATKNADEIKNISSEELGNRIKELQDDREKITGYNDVTSEDRKIIAEIDKEIELIDKEIRERKKQAEVLEGIKNKKPQSRTASGQKPKVFHVKPKPRQPENARPEADDKFVDIKDDSTKTQIRGEDNKFHQIERDSNGNIIGIKSSNVPPKS